MRGTHDKHANVTITFNSQGEQLEAPGGKKYLPCDTCGRVIAVEKNVVSCECEVCAKIREENGYVLVCPNGCLPDTEEPFYVPSELFPNRYEEGVQVMRDGSAGDHFEDGSQVTNDAHNVANDLLLKGAMPRCILCKAEAKEDF